MNRENPDGKEMMKEALERAAGEGKKVFFRVSSQRCKWCARMTGFLARPEVLSFMEKDFVMLEIDRDTVKGAPEAIANIRKPGDGTSVPWFAFLDKDGKVLKTSTTQGGGNLGFPLDSHEITAFIGMLTELSVHATPPEIQAFEGELKKYRLSL